MLLDDDVVTDGEAALGRKRTFAVQKRMSALPPVADIRRTNCHVCFVPKTDICQRGMNIQLGPYANVILLRRSLGIGAGCALK
jgi:hypothetical protein